MKKGLKYSLIASGIAACILLVIALANVIVLLTAINNANEATGTPSAPLYVERTYTYGEVDGLFESAEVKTEFESFAKLIAGNSNVIAEAVSAEFNITPSGMSNLLNMFEGEEREQVRKFITDYRLKKICYYGTYGCVGFCFKAGAAYATATDAYTYNYYLTEHTAGDSRRGTVIDAHWTKGAL